MRRRRTRVRAGQQPRCCLLVWLGLALVLASGCTHQSRNDDIEPSPLGTLATTATRSRAAHITLPCEDPIGGSNTPPTGQAKLILGTVALAAHPPILRTTGAQDGHGLFAKIGLWIHANHKATLSVAGTRGAEIMWRTNNPGPRAPTIDIPNCPATDVGTWLTYPGGFFVPRPTCVTLTVTAEDRTQTVHIPVGRTCPKPA